MKTKVTLIGIIVRPGQEEPRITTDCEMVYGSFEVPRDVDPSLVIHCLAKPSESVIRQQIGESLQRDYLAQQNAGTCP